MLFPAAPQRSLHLSPILDGRRELAGSFDPEGGAVIATALRMAETPDVAGEPARSAARRRADAHIDICRRFLDHQQPRRGRRHRPHLNLITSSARDTTTCSTWPAGTPNSSPTTPSRSPTPTATSTPATHPTTHHPSPSERMTTVASRGGPPPTGRPSVSRVLGSALPSLLWASHAGRDPGACQQQPAGPAHQGQKGLLDGHACDVGDHVWSPSVAAA